MTCALARLRKLRLIAFVFWGSNDDTRLGQPEEIEIDCFCFFETSDDMRLEQTDEIEIDCFCVYVDE